MIKFIDYAMYIGVFCNSNINIHNIPTTNTKPISYRTTTETIISNQDIYKIDEILEKITIDSIKQDR